MSDKRLLRKMKKLASRIHQQMENVRDVMDDLEIEFELLQSQISKLEVRRGKSTSNDDEVEVILDEEDEEQKDNPVKSYLHVIYNWDHLTSLMKDFMKLININPVK